MKRSMPAYTELAEALRLRRTIIADHAMRDRDPVAHLEALKNVSARILSAQAALPPPIDPRLMHCLERCSYDKALAMLEDDSAVNH